MTDTATDLVVSADGHILEPTDLFMHPPPEAPARPRRSGRRTSRSSPSSRAAPRVFRRLHTPGFEGWTISRYRQTGGRTPEGDPEIILEDLAFDGVDAAVMHPNLSLFGLYSDDHELSMAHARVYNDYIDRAVHAVLRPHRAHRARSRSPTSTTRSPRSSGSRPAGFRAVLLPATPPMPYYSRDLDPVWAAASGERRAACSSTRRPAA